MAASRESLFVWLRHLLKWRRILCALVTTSVLASLSNAIQAQEDSRPIEDSVFAELHVGDFEGDSEEEFDVSSPEAAEFDQWESLVDDDPELDCWDQSAIEPEEGQPFDWIRKFGFRHSSTHGRYSGQGFPLEGTSWLNRPLHVDWFMGPLLGSSLIHNRVSQDNATFGGIRIGLDIDYYWGLEWRYGRADSSVQYAAAQVVPNEVSYSISDIDVIYYPWGDSKVRPYCLLGFGAAQIDFLDDAGITHNATLATMPLGVGIRFYQWPWLLWRLEVLDNLSFGADGLATMNNFSFTAGMELRLGARPASYWPWRPSRKIW